MAGMEILSWTTAFFTLIYLYLDHKEKEPEIDFVKTGYGPFILGFIALCSLGVFINAPRENWVRDLGALRDFVLFFFFFYTLRIFKDVKKLFVIILACASIIAVYGIWQHYTGIDLWRHNHRALMKVPWGDDVYSTVGFFNHHLTYAYSYGMIVCIGWAILLGKQQKKVSEKILLCMSLLIILTSIICTYGRGAWIALAITFPVMAFFMRRSYGILIVLATLATGVFLYNSDSNFKYRLYTLTVDSYQSNSDRVKLWTINYQMFKDHPLVGVGYLENEPLSMSYYEKMHISNGMAGHAHNNYFEFLSTSGILGFMAYLALIFVPFIASIRLFFKIKNLEGQEAMWDRCILLAAIGAQMVFHIGGFTQATVCDSKVLHQFVLWLAVVFFMKNKYKNVFSRSHPQAAAKTT